MSFESPVSVLYDEMGKQLAVTSGSTIESNQGGIVVMGSGSGGWDYIRFNENGELKVAATVDVDLKAVTDGGSDSVTVHGDLAELRQEGAPGAERLMVSGAVDLFGPGTDSLILAINDVSGAAADTKDAVLLVSSALDATNASLGGKLDLLATETTLISVSGAIVDAKDAVYAVSSAIESLTGGKTLLLGASDQLFVSPRGATEVSGTVASIEDTSVEVLASRSTRQGATFYFEAEAAGRYCYLKFGATASSLDFTVKLTNNGYYELPANYGGSVEAVGNHATAGTLYVSEWSDDVY